MTFLTYSQTQEWLGSTGVTIDGNRNLVLPIRTTNIMVAMPTHTNLLNFLAARIVRGLRRDRQWLVWLSNWSTYPPDAFVLFEKIRLGCGESRPPLETPGHLFRADCDNEIAIVSGLIFFIMAFNWEGYIVTQEENDYIYLGDKHLVFSAEEREMQREMSDIISECKLRIITSVREAW